LNGIPSTAATDASEEGREIAREFGEMAEEFHATMQLFL